MNPVHDVARIRLDNALLLFDEFVQATIREPDLATLRGLERRFAERLQIQPSYWSQIKGRSRQIGERLARQFEQLCRKPVGWMDLPHGGAAGAVAARTSAAALGAAGAAPRTPGALNRPAGPSVSGAAASAPAPLAPLTTSPAPSPSQPQDDDERFIVGLVLTYYRRHPQRARTRLLDLLGEVLVPADQAGAPPALPGARSPTGRSAATAPVPLSSEDDRALFARSQAGVAPLKRKR